MSIVNTFSLQSNRQIKINFDGGDLSSDAGLLLIKEFISRLDIERILNRSFKTNDSAVFRYHTDRDNLLQMIYMIMAGYFEDDARYITFKLCSSWPYKEEFYDTLSAIGKLDVQLE